MKGDQMKKAMILIVALSLIITTANALSLSFESLLETILKLFDVFTDILAVLAVQILKIYVDVLEESLIANPTLYPLCDPCGPPAASVVLTSNGAIIAGMMKLLAPIYVTSVLLTGLYMIFMTESPSGRASAKNNLDKLLVSMVLVAVSPGIYQLLLDISEVMTRGIISVVRASVPAGSTLGDSVYTALMDAPSHSQYLIANLPILIVMIWSLSLALILMWFRYLIVKVFGIAFPLIIFLWLFGFTKAFGAKLLKFALVWVFTPAISALWLSLAVLMLIASQSGTFAGGMVTPLLFITAMFLMIISPLVMSGLMGWIGGLVAMVGMMIPGGLGIALAAAGGILQGKDLGSIGGSMIGMRMSMNKAMSSAMGSSGKKGGGIFKAFGAGKKTAAAGGAAKAGGKAAQAGGKAVQVAGKATSAAGKAVGAGATAAGAAISATGVGAPVGAVVAGAGKAIGVGMEVAGKVAEVAGKGAEVAGKGMNAVGKGMNVASKGVKVGSKSMKAAGKAAHAGGKGMTAVGKRVTAAGKRMSLASKGAGLKAGQSVQKAATAAKGYAKNSRIGRAVGATKRAVKGNHRLTQLNGVDRDLAQKLRVGGLKSKTAIANAKVEDIQKATGSISSDAMDIKNSAVRQTDPNYKPKADAKEKDKKDDKKDGKGGDSPGMFDKFKDDMHLKSNLASPGHRRYERGQRTADIMDGMDPE